MFGRNKKITDDGTDAHPQRAGAKNRPTPKRRDQEAARKRPLVVTDRKAARQADRAHARERTAQQRQALYTGDEAHLPARDQGPRRRFIRDFVDARRNLSEVLLPLMLIGLAASLFQAKWPMAMVVVFALVYGSALAAAIDLMLMWRRLRKQLVEKLDGPGRRDGTYAVMRAMQMRPSRLPRPQVARGEYPG